MPIDLDSLKQLAGRGWRIFPIHGVVRQGDALRCTCGVPSCKNAGKHPRTRNGLKDATTDALTIERWHRKWLDSNWALACGGLARLVVVDIDGPANAATLARLALEHGPLPETLQAITGRGRHLYFTGDVGGSHTIGDDKLLVRGEGGYVVLPGSLHASGRHYQWVDAAAPLAELPAWFARWVRTAGGIRADTIGVAPTLGIRPSYLQDANDLTARALQGLDEKHTLAEILQQLVRIPATISMDKWLNVARALHDWDSVVGLEVFKRWSATSRESRHADGQEVAEKEWQRIKNSKPGKRMIRVATLFSMAAEYPAREFQANEPSVEEVNGFHSVPAAGFGGRDDIVRPVHWIDMDEDGNPRATCANTRVAIGGLGVECRKDTFHDRLFVGGHFIRQWAGELTDEAVLMLRYRIKEQFRFDPGDRHARDAAVQLCLANQYDPVRDYLDSLTNRWDGTPRVNQWLARYMGSPCDELTQEFGRLTLLAAVTRVYRPGAKFDQILVLEGPEGKGKSSALRILAGEGNYSDARVLGTSDREQLEATSGVWIHEIAELAGMKRAEVEAIKVFASRTVDRARPAYGRFRVDRPRRCIFVATTNLRTYLKSDTGDRRFWPVATGRIEVDAIEYERDQLWAEAVHRVQAGESIGLDSKWWIEAARVQASRQELDPWHDDVKAIIDKKEVRDTSITQVLTEFLRLEIKHVGQVEQNRAARVLRMLGFERYQKREFGTQVWRYRLG